MKINHLKIHKLILSTGTTSVVNNPQAGTDFEKYINDLLNDVIAATNVKQFKIRQNTTQVIGVVSDSIINLVYKSQDDIATRLITIEINVQQSILKLQVNIQPGILVQACVEHNNARMYIICKAEETSFINEVNYLEENGYPEKKKIIKSFVAVFDNNNSISDIFVTDFNSRLAKYWWDDFLELDPRHDDIYNTTTAFAAVDKVLSSYKNYYPADHMYLRNSAIRAFRTHGEFQFENFVEEVFKNYEPSDERLNIVELINKIEQLPEKHSFDKRFDVVPKEIKAKIKSVVNLTDNIDLVIKQDIDIDNTITPILGKDNKKYIQIRSDTGYDTFVKRQSTQLPDGTTE